MAMRKPPLTAELDIKMFLRRYKRIDWAKKYPGQLAAQADKARVISRIKHGDTYVELTVEDLEHILNRQQAYRAVRDVIELKGLKPIEKFLRIRELMRGVE